MRTLCILDGERDFKAVVLEHPDKRISFVADADIDADGSPRAYRPDNRGLDDLINAKDKDGHFVGILTKNGEALKQLEGDPSPGNYISTTSYEIQSAPKGTQRRYLNSEKIPFGVVSPKIVLAVAGTILGARMRVSFRNRSVEAMVGDIGPLRKAGEISIRLAELLGIPSDPRRGGRDRADITYEIFPDEPAVIDGVTYSLQKYRK